MIDSRIWCQLIQCFKDKEGWLQVAVSSICFHMPLWKDFSRVYQCSKSTWGFSCHYQSFFFQRISNISLVRHCRMDSPIDRGETHLSYSDGHSIHNLRKDNCRLIQSSKSLSRIWVGIFGLWYLLSTKAMLFDPVPSVPPPDRNSPFWLRRNSHILSETQNKEFLL